MFDKRLLWTSGGLVAAILISVLLSGLPAAEPDTTEEPPPIAGAYGQQDIEESAPDYAYIIKEYEGRVAVFTPDKAEPEMTFDTLVKFLPDYDREQMKTGIPVKDYKELTRIIEDYIS